MDNACHTLCALALHRLGGERLGPRAGVAMLVAANLPDIDAVTALWGGLPAYLVHHRGITHAWPGLLVQAVAVAAVLASWPSRAASGPRPRFLLLLLAAGSGALSHLLLDALNAYGIRPWLPFSDRWLYFDIAFVVDPFLWLGFGIAALPAKAPSRGLLAGWVVWTAAATAFLLYAHGRFAVPLPAPILFATGMGLALLRCVRRGATAGLRWPLGGLLAVLGYLIAMAQLGALAELRANQALVAAGLLPEQVVARSRMARPAHPFVFEVIVATAADTRAVVVDLLDGTTAPGPALPRNLDAPLLERLRLTRELRAWRVFARLPVVRPGDAPGTVRLGDARFTAFGREDWSAIEVAVPR